MSDLQSVFHNLVDTYQQIRNELNVDTELSDQEKDWMLTNIQQSIQYQSQMLELEFHRR